MKFFFLFLLIPSFVFAQQLPELVVTDSLYGKNPGDLTQNMVIKDGGEVEDEYSHDALRSLETISSLHIGQNGTASGSRSAFLRGQDSDGLLILIDGMEVNDPSEANRGAILELLNSQNIERIEVLKGPQSGIYGSDAVAGVINIITKNKVENKVRLEAYSHNGKSISGSVGKYIKDNKVMLSFLKKEWDGISAAEGGSEKDGEEVDSFNLKVVKGKKGSSQWTFSLRNLSNDIDIDRGGGITNDDPNYLANQNLNQFHIGYLSPEDNGSLFRVNYSSTSREREFKNTPDTNDSTTQTDNYESSVNKTSFDHQFSINERNTVLWGTQIEIENAEMKSVGDLYNEDIDQDNENYALFAQHEYKSGRNTTTLAVRHDDYEIGGSANTYRLNYSRKMIMNSKLNLILSKGIKSPSLFQLYASTIGNKELQVESSINKEIQYSWRVEDTETYIELYDQKSKDLIGVIGSQYQNISEATFKGFEIGGRFYHHVHTVDWSYAYNEHEDGDGIRLVRRPENKFNLAASALHNDWLFKLKYTYVGNRIDYDPVSFSKITLENYQLVDIYIEKELKDYVLNASINNIFNEDYQEFAGYETMGTNFRVGVKKQF
jgi:vitamin B12 transporter